MTQTPRTVLITDGEQRASLAVVRSLGRAGFQVHVCSSRSKSIAGGSKYAKSERVVASPLSAQAQYVNDVLQYARDVNAHAVIPMTEPSVLAILPRRDEFTNIVIPFTSLDVFRNVSDKEKVLATAAQVGIHVPAQHVLESVESFAQFDINTLIFPIVVKPARSVAGHGDARAKFSVQHAADAAEFRNVVAEMDDRAYPLLLQQRIVGPGIGIFALIWNGQLVASFSHRRIREQPPSGGVSVLRESYPMDTTLLNKSIALLERFDWNGVAMIEYKIDAASGTPYLMEINGRFWGSLQLAVDAGVDFPLLLLQSAFGQNPTPVTTYNPSIKNLWFWGDVDHVVARVRRSDAVLALPPGSPTKLQMLRDFLKVESNSRNEVLRINDWRPFVRESIQWFKDLGGN